ncbi:DNA-binding protein [Flavobacterium tructae]|uniref:DNA-binding protein n=1 Tax=Flavobacterium tructae TaxID=1114873 RepID=UPI002551FE4D|nr:DNA-binding protein [Flavobacterium tructae]MDL2141719.1 DNA-binding protein [Flavobacterium tructae]
MKAVTIEQAKNMAKDMSLKKQYKRKAVYIIYCNLTEYFYIGTDGLIRNWEKLIGYYENGVYTAENKH